MYRIRVPTIPKNIRGPAPAERLLSPTWAPYSKRSFALDPYSHPLLAGVMGFDLYPSSNGQQIAASGQLIVERHYKILFAVRYDKEKPLKMTPLVG